MQQDTIRTNEMLEVKDSKIAELKRQNTALVEELDLQQENNTQLKSCMSQAKLQIKYLEDAIIKKDDKMKKLEEYKRNSQLDRNSPVTMKLFANMQEMIYDEQFYSSSNNGSFV